MIGWAGPRGVGTARVFAHHALVLGDLGRGDFESAYHHATTVSPAGTLASHVPHSLWIAMDLVEAAVRTDRRAEAERHVRALQEAQTAGALTQTGDPRPPGPRAWRPGTMMRPRSSRKRSAFPRSTSGRSMSRAYVSRTANGCDAPAR